MKKDNEYYNKLIYRLDMLSQVKNKAKAIPYIGWFWRYIGFTPTSKIVIAFEENNEGGIDVGICVNNKDDLPERNLDDYELDQFLFYIDLIDEAETDEEKLKICYECKDWIQTLKYEVDDV